MTTSTTTIIAAAINCSNFDIRASPPPVHCSTVWNEENVKANFVAEFYARQREKHRKKCRNINIYVCMCVCVAGSSLIMLFLLGSHEIWKIHMVFHSRVHQAWQLSSYICGFGCYSFGYRILLVFVRMRFTSSPPKYHSNSEFCLICVRWMDKTCAVVESKCWKFIITLLQAFNRSISSPCGFLRLMVWDMRGHVRYYAICDILILLIRCHRHLF